MLIEQDFDRRLALSPAVMAEAGRQRLSIGKLGDIPQRRLQAPVHARPSWLHEVCVERVNFDARSEESRQPIALGLTPQSQVCHRWDRGFFWIFPQMQVWERRVERVGNSQISTSPALAALRRRLSTNLPGARSRLISRSDALRPRG